MRELIENIAKSLVDNPDEIKINISNLEDETILYELSVHPDDMGKIIGKSGRIVKAIRNIIKAAAKVQNKKVVFEII